MLPIDRIDKFLQGEDYRAMYIKVRDELADLQQRTWIDLTDEEISAVLGSDIHAEQSGELSFIRAIEAKLKEKNT